jgi:hypothetical protein
MTRPTTTHRSLLTLALAATLAFGGCAGDGARPVDATGSATASGDSPTAPTGSDATDPPAPPSPSDPPGPPFSVEDAQADLWPDPTRTGLGKAVRVGHHDGFDRVVYEFTGQTPPTWLVRYVDTPIEDPSGERVDVSGDTFLEVQVAGLDYPRKRDREPGAPAAQALSATRIVDAGVLFAGFEGYGQTFIGLAGDPRPFRVFTLSAPSRLVVDIQSG